MDQDSALFKQESGRWGETVVRAFGRLGSVVIAVLDRRQRPRCRRAHFDPRSALRARILFGEG
jgi:hypothetical protein